MEHKYRISVRMGDVSFDVESTDIKWVESKERDYLKKLSDKSVRRVPEDEGGTVETRSPEVVPKMTLNEFYRRYVKKIKSRVSIAVYFVYYLEKIRKTGKIKTGDVTGCFRGIGYPNWNRINMSDTLASAKRRALVNCVNKLWSLTTTGEDYVFNAIAGKKK